MVKDLTDVVGSNTFLGEPAHLLVDSRSQTSRSRDTEARRGGQGGEEGGTPIPVSLEQEK